MSGKPSARYPRLRRASETLSQKLRVLTSILAIAILIPFLLQLLTSGSILSFLPTGTVAALIAANLLTVSGILLGLSSMVEKQYNALAALITVISVLLSLVTTVVAGTTVALSTLDLFWTRPLLLADLIIFSISTSIYAITLAVKAA